VSEPTKLRALFCAVGAGYSEWYGKEMPASDEAWRVVDEYEAGSSIEFANKRDCQRFIEVLAKRGIVDGDTFDAAPIDDIRQAVGDSIQW
jgi:hypothetical protein